MFRFLATRHNLRKPDLWGGETRMHTLPSGEAVPATSKFVVLHLRFHRFHRSFDRDFHNHQFEFWTFPFRSYREEYLSPENHEGERTAHIRVIPAGQWTYKTPLEPHRILEPCTRAGEPLSWLTHDVRTVIWRGRVNPAGTTGFYLPTQRPNRYDFLTFEQYVAAQRARDTQRRVARS